MALPQKEPNLDAKSVFSVISGVLFVAAFVPYIRAIWADRHRPDGVKPAKASWLIWASLDSITFVSMAIKGTLNGQIWAAIFGAWVVAIIAIRYGVGGWKILDKVCMVGAVVAVVLGFVFDPVIAIMTSQIALLLGAIPTFGSAWKTPESEDKNAWTLFFLSCVYAILAIEHWTLADAAQPVTFTVIETIMMVLLFIKPRFAQRREN